LIELADTSAWSVRHRDSALEEEFEKSVRVGSIASCTAVRAELLRSTRDAAEFATTRAGLARLPDCPIEPREWERAMDVMETFARRGPLHHRQVPFSDLLVAAAAETAGVSVLHYDRHFELIAEVTGQPVRAIAPFGSL
jgi:predicted nucleic acid-binding protein